MEWGTEGATQGTGGGLAGEHARSGSAWQAGTMSATTDEMATDDEPLAFTCPRCRLEVEEVFYGPCTSCRTTLRVTQAREGRDVETADYVPKMNVTPNAVASKE